ncbi:ABC transporter substrate-binding protein [Pseudonocardia sp. RS010]|uniref:ABC transporter substrate-binding protein n=1 Tax=Pseudonocardia sp. RS010 TaxID=3385979 RepID=UPI0039A0B406
MLRTTAVVAMVIAVVAACGGSGGGAVESSAPYKVGVLLGLTGAYASVSEPEQKALQLYADRVNAAGGINGHPLQLVVADTGSNETEAVNQLRKLVTQEQVVAVLGPSSSGEAAALRPISAQLKTPVLAIASANSIIEPAAESTYMFKEFPDSTDSLRAQLKYAQEQGWTRIAMLSSNNGYGQDPAKALPQVIGEFPGLQLVGSEVFSPTATDVTAQLSALRGGNPDALLVWCVNPANAVVARNVRDSGFPAHLLQAPGAASSEYLHLGGSSVEGTLLQGSKVLVADQVAADDPQRGVLTDFVAAYKAAYEGEAPSQYAASGWDSAMLLAEAMKTIPAQTSAVQDIRESIRTGLEGLKGISGNLAVYNYSAQRHGPTGIEGLAIIRVQNGAFTLVQSY